MNLMPQKERHARGIVARIVALFDEDTSDATKRACLRADLWEAQEQRVTQRVIELLPERDDLRAALEHLEDNGGFRT